MSLYNYIITKSSDSADLKQKMEETVHQLSIASIDYEHHGMDYSGSNSVYEPAGYSG
jgi:hypothetical protein